MKSYMGVRIKGWIRALIVVLTLCTTGNMMGFSSPGGDGVIDKIQTLEFWGFLTYCVGLCVGTQILCHYRAIVTMNKAVDDYIEENKT